MLYAGNLVIGVRTGDRGIDRDDERKATFEPGVDIHAKVTVLADGVRGNLTKTLIRRFDLDAGRSPQSYAIGKKELWDVDPHRMPTGSVMDTMGHPLRFEVFGGGFVYALPEGRLSVGFVAGLDYREPLFDPHVRQQGDGVRVGALVVDVSHPGCPHVPTRRLPSRGFLREHERPGRCASRACRRATAIHAGAVGGIVLVSAGGKAIGSRALPSACRRQADRPQCMLDCPLRLGADFRNTDARRVFRATTEETRSTRAFHVAI